MQLSEHLSLAEVIRSDSAKRNGISNMPPADHINNLKVLATKVFEPIRAHFGVPIHISSGYRSEELNRLIKGSATSQHCTGEAIDIDMEGSGSGVTNVDVFNYVKDHMVFDQLIWEFGDNHSPSWVHVSYESAGRQRRQVLKALKLGGKTVYKPYNQ